VRSPDDLDHLVDIGNQYVATGKSIDAEARVRRHDGTYRWFLFRPAPARDETGKVVGWVRRDYRHRDRKQAEEELRRSEAFLSKVSALVQTGTSHGIGPPTRYICAESIVSSSLTRRPVVTLGRMRERTHPETAR